ncbi:MAG: hypothetical protein NUW37_17210 [Planctomycetes bacterium]|nr:hypothetical protein [Planctomycetota bacterium]
MKFNGLMLLSALFALAFAISCGGDDKDQDGDVTTVAMTPEKAKEIAMSTYNTLCVTCHSESYRSAQVAANQPVPADFEDPAFWARADVTDDYLRKIISEGGIAVGKSPLMTGAPGLKGEANLPALNALIEHLRSLKKAE